MTPSADCMVRRLYVDHVKTSLVTAQVRSSAAAVVAGVQCRNDCVAMGRVTHLYSYWPLESSRALPVSESQSLAQVDHLPEPDIRQHTGRILAPFRSAFRVKLLQSIPAGLVQPKRSRDHVGSDFMLSPSSI